MVDPEQCEISLHLLLNTIIMDIDSGEENEAGINVHPVHEAELNKFKLVKEDIIILQDHWKEWQDSKGSAQTSVAMKAYEEMLKRDLGLKKDTLKAKEAHKLKRQVTVAHQSLN